MIPSRFRTLVEFLIVIALLFAAIFLPDPARKVAGSMFGLTEVASHE